MKLECSKDYKLLLNQPRGEQQGIYKLIRKVRKVNINTELNRDEDKQDSETPKMKPNDEKQENENGA